MTVYVEECEKAGLDCKEMEKLVNLLNRAGKMAEEMELTIFGGSGSGSLRFRENNDIGCLIVASIYPGNFDGGDGACGPDEDGLMRGEY